MRKLFGLLVAGALTLGIAAPSSASTLSFTGTLLLNVGALPPAAFTGSGLASVNSSGGFHINVLTGFAGAVIPPTSLFTGVPQINGLQITVTGLGAVTQPFTLTNNSTLLHAPTLLLPHSGIGGTAPLGGQAVINILGFIFLAIPLGVLGGGTQTIGYAGPNPITVIGTHFSAESGVITAVTTTPTPAVTNPFGMSTLVGTDNRTGNHGGQITLVSPGKAITGAGLAGNLPLILTLSLNFVPEPGTLLLLGSGAVGFALLARRRMRQ